MKSIRTGGSFRRMGSAAGGSESEYMTTILAPFTGPSGIPDTNLTTSFPKATSFSDNFLVGATPTIAYMYLPHNKNNPLRMYLYTSSGDLGQGFYFLKTIHLDQDLAADFTFGRFVSGGVTIQSSTIAAGAFAVAGTCNAAAVQEFPDMLSLTFNQISSHKRNPRDVKVGVPASQGVTCIASPDSDNRYKVFDTTETFNLDGIVRVLDTTDSTQRAGLPTAWNLSPIPNGSSANLYSTFDNAPRGSIIPPNAWGQIDCECVVTIQFAAAAAGTITATLDMQGYQTNAGGTVSTFAQSTTWFGSYPAAAGNLITIPMKCYWNSDINLEAIYVSVITSTPFTAFLLRPSYVETKYWEYYDEGFNRTGFLVGFDGISNGQTLTVSGVENDEVIPNSSLAKNITTTYFAPFKPFELEMVSAYLADADLHKLRFLWTADEYRMWIAQQAHTKHTDFGHIATASGFGDMFKTLLGAARIGMPMIGGYVGGPLGNAIGALGSSIIDGVLPPST